MLKEVSDAIGSARTPMRTIWWKTCETLDGWPRKGARSVQ